MRVMSDLRDGSLDLARAAAALALRLPAPLGVFARLAYDYRWSWWPGGSELFRSIDPYRWESCGENPVRLLQEAPLVALARAAEDRALVERADEIAREIERVRQPDTDVPGLDPARPVAFLCAEYGVHGSLPIYAGGLGVLAGDIVKEASDCGLPFVAVGLLYGQGSFHQRLDPSGWQHEYWAEVDPARLPAALVTNGDGLPQKISVPFRDRDVVAQIWRVQVGRVPLLLLDTRCPENDRTDRWLTSRLYVGDRTLRLGQYLLLGVGGIRALRALGFAPSVVHLNEGHAAFASLELAREGVVAGQSFDDALASAQAQTVFTTHTPVPAGNDSYTSREIESIAGRFVSSLGCELDRVLALGRTRPDDPADVFGMTPLALRTSRVAKGVSRRHGRVAREMWHSLWPDRPVEAVPIGHVTNGVHAHTWMAPEMRALLDRHLGPLWRERATDPGLFAAVDQIPDEEIWAVRCALRGQLVHYVRERSVEDRLARGEASLDYVEAAARTFDEDFLTIGFARRLATYKRLHLLVHDTARALALLDGDRPLQVLIAGKAHPSDDEAKRIVQRLFPLRGTGRVGQRVAYLEDYDLGMAAHLVRGCDVWVNLPRAPLEASGTSGMKSALNGGLHLSVLDGWWEEAYDGTNGWGIGGESAHDEAAQDARDAGTLYHLLEHEIVPAFYERDAAGIPRAWAKRVKASLRSIVPRFCATRMIADYVSSAYRGEPR